MPRSDAAAWVSSTGTPQAARPGRRDQGHAARGRRRTLLARRPAAGDDQIAIRSSRCMISSCCPTIPRCWSWSGLKAPTCVSSFHAQGVHFPRTEGTALDATRPVRAWWLPPTSASSTATSSPSNLLLDSLGLARVADFGLVVRPGDVGRTPVPGRQRDGYALLHGPRAGRRPAQCRFTRAGHLQFWRDLLPRLDRQAPVRGRNRVLGPLQA